MLGPSGNFKAVEQHYVEAVHTSGFECKFAMFKPEGAVSLFVVVVSSFGGRHSDLRDRFDRSCQQVSRRCLQRKKSYCSF